MMQFSVSLSFQLESSACVCTTIGLYSSVLSIYRNEFYILRASKNCLLLVCQTQHSINRMTVFPLTWWIWVSTEYNIINRFTLEWLRLKCNAFIDIICLHRCHRFQRRCIHSLNFQSFSNCQQWAQTTKRQAKKPSNDSLILWCIVSGLRFSFLFTSRKIFQTTFQSKTHNCRIFVVCIHITSFSFCLLFFLHYTKRLEKSSTAFFTRIIRFTSTYIHGIESIENGGVEMAKKKQSNKILICVSRLNLLLLICHTLLAVYLIWRQLCHEMRFTQ